MKTKTRVSISDPENNRKVVGVLDMETGLIQLADGRVYHKSQVEILEDFGTDIYA